MSYKVMGMARNRTLRVLWMLEELGEPYEYVEMMPRTPECVALNPSGKVPVLEVDGQIVTDSVAIVQFLADKHGRFTAPAGTLERARQDGLTQFAVDELEGALWNLSKHKFVLPKELRLAEMREVCVYDLNKAMTSLEKRLETIGSGGPYAFGEDLTVPDILLGHCSLWIDAAKLERPTGPVATYLQAVTARPALQRLLDRHPSR